MKPVQIPDSTANTKPADWAKFRGVAKLKPSPALEPVIPSAELWLSLVRKLAPK